MAAHDPIAYRPLLLRLAQSGTGVLPMGALRLLAAYARWAAGAAGGGGCASRPSHSSIPAFQQTTIASCPVRAALLLSRGNAHSCLPPARPPAPAAASSRASSPAMSCPSRRPATLCWPSARQLP